MVYLSWSVLTPVSLCLCAQAIFFFFSWRLVGLPIRTLYIENPKRRQYTLARLENMQYKIDRENTTRYAELARQKSPQPQWFKVILNRLTGTRYHKPVQFMGWKQIVRLADYTGVPPEVFVDEDYYFNKYGIAGYRLMFEIHRRGISLAELTDPSERDAQTEARLAAWYRTWYFVLKGNINASVHGGLLSRILIICYRKTGIPLGTILGKQLHSSAKAVGVHGELTDVLTTLGRRECAFLAGVARAVSHYCMNSLGDGVLTENVNKLLGWYFGAQNGQARVSVEEEKPRTEAGVVK